MLSPFAPLDPLSAPFLATETDWRHLDPGEAHSGCGGGEKSEEVQLSAFRIAVDSSRTVLSSELLSEFWWPLPLLIKGAMRKL